MPEEFSKWNLRKSDAHDIAGRLQANDDIHDARVILGGPNDQENSHCVVAEFDVDGMKGTVSVHEVEHPDIEEVLSDV